jgi:hypothetical protein
MTKALIEELPMISPRESNDTVRPGQAGFTLIELAVALGVTTIVMLGILFLFDFNNKLARVQTNVADMQQSLRIAQYDMVRLVRMAGRGGLNATQGIAITRDVGDDVHLIDGGPKILEGTDVLTVRGVIETPIYQVSFTIPGAYVLYNGATALPPGETEDAITGIVEICRLSPAGSIQDLTAISARLNLAQGEHGEALSLVSPMGDDFYAVVELKAWELLLDSVPCPPAPSGEPESLQLKFTIDSEYSHLGAPTADAQAVALSRVAYVGFLEEYRFYVREDHAILEDEGSELTPVLSRARFYPGTDFPYVKDADIADVDKRREIMQQDIADGILDLQIAMGLDVDGDGLVKEDLVLPGEDEWLGNADGEAAIDGGLKNLRISTLARTTRLDHDYSAPDITAIEDHPYTLTTGDRLNGRTARHFRRRLLQTIVNLRNITT